MKILSHQLKAIRIYKNIQKIKTESVQELRGSGFFSRIEDAVSKMLKENDIDQKTACILRLLITESADGQDRDNSLSVEITTIDKLLKLIDLTTSTENVAPIQQIIYLSRNGDLVRDPRERFCYHMKNAAQRVSILRTLNSSYMETVKIKNAVKSKNNKALRKTINTINHKTGYHLKIQGPLIEAKSGCGYRINPAYELIVE